MLSQHGEEDGHGTRAEGCRSRRQDRWTGGGGEAHKTSAFTRCPTATTDLPSPEFPQELSSPMRRPRPLEHSPARIAPVLESAFAPERIIGDIWRDPSPEAPPQESTNQTSGTRGRDRDGHRSGGGADLYCGGTVGEGGGRNSVRNLAAMFGGGTPPGTAGERASALSSRTTSSEPAGGERSPPPIPSSSVIDHTPSSRSPRKLGTGAKAASLVPPSSSLPEPHGQTTGLRGSNRLDLLRARTKGTGVVQDIGGEGCIEVDVDRSRQYIGGRGSEKKDDEAAEGILAPPRRNASNRSGLTIAENLNRGGLLSKSGTLRLKAAAAGRGKRPGSEAAAKNATDRPTAHQLPRNHGGRKGDAESGPTTTIPTAARGAGGDIRGGDGGDHGEGGVRHDGRTSDARGYRSQTSKGNPAPACTTTASDITVGTRSDERLVSARIRGAEVGRAVPEIAPGALRSTHQPRGSSPDSHPGPSPASISGYSSPPSVERRRRTFFGSPRQARTGSVDGGGGVDAGADGGSGGDDGALGGANTAAKLKTKRRKQVQARASLARDEEADVTAPANANSRPTTSVKAAAAAALRDGRRTASRSRGGPRSSSVSPTSTPRGNDLTTGGVAGHGGDAVNGGSGAGGGGGNGNVASKTEGASMRRRSTGGSTSVDTTATAAAVVATTRALKPKTPSGWGNGSQAARPNT